MNQKRKISGVIGRIVVITLIYIAAIVPAIYINTIYGYLPVLFITLALLISLISFVFIKKGISFYMETDDATCYRGDKVEVSLVIKNNSFLMCPRAIATLFISDIFGESETEMQTFFIMDSRNESRFSFDITMDHIGVYSAGLKKLVIYDFFGLFSSTINEVTTFSVTVLPKLYDFAQESLNDQLITESINVAATAESDGWDYTGVREYAIGDSMKRIHWKLSAHSSEYMTKITETSRKCDVGVILDFVSDRYSHKDLAFINDALIEGALSCIHGIEKKQMDYSLIYQNNMNEMSRAIPRGEENLLSLIISFPVIKCGDDEDFPNAANIIEEEARATNRCTNLIVFTSHLTDELINQLLIAGRQGRVPILYYVLPKGTTKKECESKMARLRALDSSAISYYSIIAGKAGDLSE